ncbi:Soh1p [Saccharomyces cerevisiae x Saccharomyces kudriavzevii VIN7]|uniref:Mediator of RNA polymerase II transcription subunit 31 n=1 Tax=Saccharomyces cerevisiae x Saccharomyces kudriavzevii (strain VIN7) TaxID=1095631 RepID=H0GUP4_SACCK|nr:Soh1p [Saccharomyces cerevisiae x Saccharomyces kudriavzevii VIN7]
MSDANGTSPSDQNPLPTRFEVELDVRPVLGKHSIRNLLAHPTTDMEVAQLQNYLKYLEYWCNPPYSQCIVYPNCLFILKLLNGFMESAIVNEDGLLEGLDELPKIIQLQGPQWMTKWWKDGPTRLRPRTTILAYIHTPAYIPIYIYIYMYMYLSTCKQTA